VNNARTTPDNPVASGDAPDNHVCRPGATVYYCPTAGDTESDCHGGFDTCCAHPELHQQLLQCSLAYCRQAHPGHSWEPQPGMKRVHCEGYSSVPADAWSTQPCGREKPHPAHKFMRGRASRQCPGVQKTSNSPGSTPEQLPADVLELLAHRTYLSTACETARLIDGAIIRNPEHDNLPRWRDRMHQQCRLNNTFTGKPCSCPCHPSAAS